MWTLPQRRIVTQSWRDKQTSARPCSFFEENSKHYCKSIGEQLKNFMQIINKITISEFRKRSLWTNVVNRQGRGGKQNSANLPACQAAVPSAWAAIMKYHRLAVLNDKKLFLTVLQLEVQDQGASQFDSW